jgi:2,4-dienoyl-CoA reductase-like NADH-dependent reductase (Old Yellow Enzyme family)
MARLFDPFRRGPFDLANRIVVSPMCQYSGQDGLPTAWHRQHLGQLALSGAGLVIVEATAVTIEGRITHGCLGLWSDAHEAAFAGLLREVRGYAPAAKFGLQIGHAGRKASSRRMWEGGQPLGPDERPWPTVAASAITQEPGRPVPDALDEAGIARIVQGFADAARRADRAGFDALELHAAHGYLLHGFHSPIANQRQDDWGGDPVRRRRLLLDVARAARAAWPRSKPLGMRVTGQDWVEGGLTVEDAVDLARDLEAAGLDFVVPSSGGILPTIRVPVAPGYQAPFAEAVKRATGLAVMTVGMIVDPEQADAVVAEDRADLVAMARAFLDDPRWPWHAADKLGVEIARPNQWARAAPKLWPGAALRRG